MKRNARLADREVDALLRAGATGDEGLTAALALLRREGAGPAPTPSTALAAQLSEGFIAPTAVALKPARRRLQISLVVAGAASGLLMAATGANALPAPGQRAIAGILNAITPFDFPTPATDDSESPKPAPVVKPTKPVVVPNVEPGETPSSNEGNETESPDVSDGTDEGTDAPSSTGPDSEPASEPTADPVDSGDSTPSGEGSPDASPSPVDEPAVAPDGASASSPDGD